MKRLPSIPSNTEMWCIHDSEADDFFNMFFNMLRCMNEKGEFDTNNLESIYFVASYRDSLLHKIVTEDKLFAILDGRYDTQGQLIEHDWLINYVQSHVKMGKAIADKDYCLTPTTAASLNYAVEHKLATLSPEFKSRYELLKQNHKLLQDDIILVNPENNSCEIQVIAAWDDVLEIISALENSEHQVSHFLTAAAGNDAVGNLTFNSAVSPVAFNKGQEMLDAAINIKHKLLSTVDISQMTALNGFRIGSSLCPKNSPTIATALVDGVLQKDPFITKLALLSRSWNEHIVKILSDTKPDHPLIAEITKFKCTQFCPADLIVAIISSQRANGIVDNSVEEYLLDFGTIITTYIRTNPNRIYDEQSRIFAEQLIEKTIIAGKETDELLSLFNLNVANIPDIGSTKRLKHF